MSGVRLSGRYRRDQVAYLLAWLAGASFIILLLGYGWLLRLAPHGWLNAFLRDLAGGLAAVAVTYLIAYVALFRRGLGRDQQLVEEIVEGLSHRSAVAPEVVGFSAHPGRLPWDELLDEADEVDVAGRWFAAWTNENYDALRRFFARGGKLRAVMLSPSNESSIAHGARQHAGFGEGAALEPARHKIETGARRLRDAVTTGGKGSLELRYIVASDVVIAQTLFRFASARHELLVLYAHDNFRADRHRAPALVLDLRSSAELREFWDTEIAGFMRNSQPAPTDPTSNEDG
jgi:hypothetical protein